MIKKISLLFIIVCIPCSTLFGSNNKRVFGKTFFNPRSQGSNTARYLVGWAQEIFDCSCTFNGGIAAVPSYAQTFDNAETGIFLFFNEDPEIKTNVMKFGPADGAGVDVFAGNFLLNYNDTSTFTGTIKAQPEVQNALIDFNLYLGLDCFCPNVFIIAQAPLVWTKWKMNFEENISDPGTVIQQGQLGNNVAAVPAPVNSIIAAWKGDITFFDVMDKMNFARVDGGQTEIKLADIRVGLGYYVYRCEWATFALMLRAVFPTGTRPNGEFLFEPIIGNGHHYEIGAGALGSVQLWNNGCDQLLNAYFYGNIYHMFKTKQKRTFDLLTNGPGSRYLLFKRFSGAFYADEIVRGPNILTLDVDVRNNVQGDMSLMLLYQKCGFTIDIGYNLWGRTRDRISLREDSQIPTNTFGIAGITGTIDVGRNQTASLTKITGENADNINPGGPVFISNANLDIESAEHPGTFSHAIFAHFSHMWDRCRFSPFFGFGGLVEFSGRDNRALKMWHIWAKGGIIWG